MVLHQEWTFMMRMLIFPAVLSTLLFFTGFVHAADVIKVKGSSALIDLKGEPAVPGDLFYAVSSDGKKRAIVSITKVKGDKALGRITKGKAGPGMTLEPKSPSALAPASRSAKNTPTGQMYWGGMLGVAMDKANVKVLWQSTGVGHTAGDTKEVAALSGTSFSAMGLFDYSFTPQFWVRGFGGIENFNVSGPASCGEGNNSTCDSKIMYLNASAVARWLFMTGNIRPWAGAGVGVMFPLTKSSTAFDSDSIAGTQVILFQGGVDWFLSPKMYVPISLEYGLLPKSAQVEASWIEVRVGLAVPF
jgi:hypothetical protein